MHGGRSLAGLVGLALLVVGCGGGDDERTATPPAAEDAGSEVGDGGAGDGAVDAESDSGDAGLDGGALDAGTSTKGVTAGAMVTGGQWMKSASYQLVMTVGQSPGGNEAMRSPGYQLRAGLVGSTQP